MSAPGWDSVASAFIALFAAMPAPSMGFGSLCVRPWPPSDAARAHQQGVQEQDGVERAQRHGQMWVLGRIVRVQM